MTRTDAHRPSAINPDEYDYVSCDYFGQWGSVMHAIDRAHFRAHMERTGGKHAQKFNTGSCHICGAAAMYVARYYHRPSNTYITTGMDCASKMDMPGDENFSAFRKLVRDARKAVAGKKKAQAMLADLGLADAWKLYDYGYDDGWRREEPIVQSIVDKLVRYGSISDPQVALVSKLLVDNADRPRRDAELQAKREEEAATSKYVGSLGERAEFELTVDFTTSFDTQFGIMHVHIMRDATGNVIVYKGSSIAKRGERIKVKGTVKEHKAYKGVAQTIISRPKVLEVVA